ncbi:MAG: restriction endonuclease [Anaerolineales bacterium]|nr:restriction endonuclease [Anaerolineales bacterium]
MDPIRFEELIKVLLEEMGYEHLATTAPSNDKGWMSLARLNWASAPFGRWCR